jgi:hypothetical protein
MSSADPEVYDKASWHTGGSWPEGLPEEQACVHAGLLFGWMIERGLTSEGFSADFPELVEGFRTRRKSGPQVYALAGGVLASDMLNETGNAFARDYVDPERGSFLAEYETLLASGLPSAYHVADTWASYETLRAHLDARFADWERSRSKA